ncbi:MAG: response regulator transcription factor [Bacteroidetes bacterium]|nr:response regulator transcription factor [Bacteroidota bacterium]
MKILVVDDDKMILEAISHHLSAEGYEVITATNGLQALEMAQNKKLDLIISDIMMPDLSGLSLLSMLKQFYFNKIPVIIISSLDKSDIILSSLGLGADDFMAKPINFKELSIRVKKYVKKSVADEKSK